MDLVTHAITGLALGTLSGEPFSVSSPIYLSSMLGAMAPDIDIAWGYKKLQRRRDLPCWLQHRSITHSIFGIPLLALGIALTLGSLFSGTSFAMLFLFALTGALSHSLLDLMNCYGVNILWPFKKKAYSLNFIPLFDPILILFYLFIIATANNVIHAAVFPMLFTYIALRWMLLYKMKNNALKNYDVSPEAIQIIPARINPRKWILSINENEITEEVILYPQKNVFKNMIKAK